MVTAAQAPISNQPPLYADMQSGVERRKPAPQTKGNISAASQQALKPNPSLFQSLTLPKITRTRVGLGAMLLSFGALTYILRLPLFGAVRQRVLQTPQQAYENDLRVGTEKLGIPLDKLISVDLTKIEDVCQFISPPEEPREAIQLPDLETLRKMENYGTQVNGLITYEGQMKDNKRHGWGVSYSVDGKKSFEGWWEAGKIVKGIIYNPDGSIYESGEFGNGLNLHGWGMSNSLGVTIGNFINGKPDPTDSTEFYQNGKIKKKVFDGKTISCDDQGNLKYVGEWNGKQNGYGIYFWYGKNIISHAGYWENDKMHGMGTGYRQDGHKFQEGLWQNDKFLEGTYFQANGEKMLEEWPSGAKIYYGDDGCYKFTKSNPSEEAVIRAKNECRFPSLADKISDYITNFWRQ